MFHSIWWQFPQPTFELISALAGPKIHEQNINSSTSKNKGSNRKTLYETKKKLKR